jgi:hypothetical protein
MDIKRTSFRSIICGLVRRDVDDGAGHLAARDVSRMDDAKGEHNALEAVAMKLPDPWFLKILRRGQDGKEQERQREHHARADDSREVEHAVVVDAVHLPPVVQTRASNVERPSRASVGDGLPIHVSAFLVLHEDSIRTISILPHFSTTLYTPRSTLSGSFTTILTARLSTLYELCSSFTSASAGPADELYATATFAPASAYARATAAPMPVAPPVMSAVRPLSEKRAKTESGSAGVGRGREEEDIVVTSSMKYQVSPGRCTTKTR